MKLNLKNIHVPKFNPTRLLRLLPIATMLLLLGVLVWCMTFLYHYFYQTIANVKVVRTLQNQVALGQINLPLYQEVLGDLQKKKEFNAETVVGLHDPFSPPSAPPSQTPTPPPPTP
jgi:hypothetical protein